MAVVASSGVLEPLKVRLPRVFCISTHLLDESRAVGKAPATFPGLSAPRSASPGQAARALFQRMLASLEARCGSTQLLPAGNDKKEVRVNRLRRYQDLAKLPPYRHPKCCMVNSACFVYKCNTPKKSGEGVLPLKLVCQGIKAFTVLPADRQKALIVYRVRCVGACCGLAAAAEQEIPQPRSLANEHRIGGGCTLTKVSSMPALPRMTTPARYSWTSVSPSRPVSIATRFGRPNCALTVSSTCQNKRLAGTPCSTASET